MLQRNTEKNTFSLASKMMLENLPKICCKCSRKCEHQPQQIYKGTPLLKIFFSAKKSKFYVEAV